MTWSADWGRVEAPWRASFHLAWEAFAAGTIPVGAVVVDEAGRIVAEGRNRIFNDAAPARQLAATRLAHAELNALAQLSNARRGTPSACTRPSSPATVRHRHLRRLGRTDPLCGQRPPQWRQCARLTPISSRLVRSADPPGPARVFARVARRSAAPRVLLVPRQGQLERAGRDLSRPPTPTLPPRSNADRPPKKGWSRRRPGRARSAVARRLTQRAREHCRTLAHPSVLSRLGVAAGALFGWSRSDPKKPITQGMWRVRMRRCRWLRRSP